MRSIVYIFILLSGVALGQTYSLDTTYISWGERATITGRVGASIGEEVTDFEAWTDSIGSLEVLEILGPDTVKPSANDPAEWDYVLEKKWIVTGWDSGYVAIDSTVYLGVAPTHSNEAIGHAGIVEVKWTPYEQIQRAIPYLLYLIVLAGLALVVWLVLKRIQKKEIVEKVEVEDIRPAHQIALEQLEELKRRESWTKGDAKTFQVQLSAIIRRYIDKRFHVSSLDKTSHEATAIIRMLPIGEADKQAVVSALLTGDQIKFAKFKAKSDVHLKSLQSCIDFVKNTQKDEVA